LPKKKYEVEEGGVLDIGSYKEGYCFKLTSTTGIEWTFCCDTSEEK